jgi:hypothetical protein
MRRVHRRLEFHLQTRSTITRFEPPSRQQENRGRMRGNCAVFGDGCHPRSCADAGFCRLAARSWTHRLPCLLDHYAERSSSPAASTRSFAGPKRHHYPVSSTLSIKRHSKVPRLSVERAGVGLATIYLTHQCMLGWFPEVVESLVVSGFTFQIGLFLEMHQPSI